jgi:hypothetical protein
MARAVEGVLLGKDHTIPQGSVASDEWVWELPGVVGPKRSWSRTSSWAALSSSASARSPAATCLPRWSTGAPYSPRDAEIPTDVPLVSDELSGNVRVAATGPRGQGTSFVSVSLLGSNVCMFCNYVGKRNGGERDEEEGVLFLSFFPQS